MQVQNTNPGLRQDIIKGLTKWQEGQDNNETFMTMAAQEQALLG